MPTAGTAIAIGVSAVSYSLVSCNQRSFTMGDAPEDLVGGLCPHEGVRCLVVRFDIFAERRG